MEDPSDPAISPAVSATLGGAAAVAQAPSPSPESGDAPPIADRRARLIAGGALLLGLPFALKAGAEFFLPVTISLVIAIALIPVLEWLERRRLPSWLAALLCVISFLALANVALAAIVVPAIEFFRRLPERIDRIQANLAPLLDLYQTLEKYMNRTITHLANTGPVKAPATAAVSPPGSLLELAATSAPAAIIQVFFGVLVVFFFLAGWTRARRKTITSRQSFGGAMAPAREIQDVVDDVSADFGTSRLINVVRGAIVGTGLWAGGMPYPAMWGGIAALLNYVPYFGPIVAALLLAIGGLMTFNDFWVAMLPAAIMIGCHLVEANVVPPQIDGR